MGILSKEKSYLGVDIGAHGLKIVELKNTKNRPQLWTYGILEQKLDIHLHNAEEKNILIFEKFIRASRRGEKSDDLRNNLPAFFQGESVLLITPVIHL